VERNESEAEEHAEGEGNTDLAKIGLGFAAFQGSISCSPEASKKKCVADVSEKHAARSYQMRINPIKSLTRRTRPDLKTNELGATGRPLAPEKGVISRRKGSEESYGIGIETSYRETVESASQDQSGPISARKGKNPRVDQTRKEILAKEGEKTEKDA